MELVLTNNAQSTLQFGVSISDSTIVVESAEGALFPSPGVNEWFPLTLVKLDGSGHEIVKATGRSGDIISIERAQEDTTAKEFVAGDIVSLRLTAEAVRSLRANNPSVIAESITDGTGRFAINENINVYEDNMLFNFIAHAGVDSNVEPTLRVNDLVAYPIKKIEMGNLVPAGINDITQGEVVTVYYSQVDSAFVIATVSHQATEESLGGVYIAGETESTFDIAGDNAKAMTQQSVSKLVESHEQGTSVPNAPWYLRNYGRASSNDVTHSISTTYNAHSDTEYRTFTIEGTCTYSPDPNNNYGVHIIRATEEIVINGNVILPDGVARGYDKFIGGYGENRAGSGHANDALIVREEPPVIASQRAGLQVNFDRVRSLLKQGVPLTWFRGGMGSGNWKSNCINQFDYDPTGATDYGDDARMCPGGALVLIAPSIVIGSTAKFVMNSRRNFTGSTLAGDSAGGFLIAVSKPDGVSIDPSTTFAAGYDPAVFQNAATLANQRAARNGGAGPSSTECNASNGQAVIIDNVNMLVTDIF